MDENGLSEEEFMERCKKKADQIAAISRQADQETDDKVELVTFGGDYKGGAS